MKSEGIEHVAVIGTGMIGASLAVLFTGNGYRTTMLAMSGRGKEAGYLRYDDYYNDLEEKGLVTADQAQICRRYLNISQDISSIADADFIVECIAEKLEIKYNIYSQIEENCRQFKVLVSTTSALSPEELCSGIRAKERFAVAHPYNPPHLVPCVEIVPSCHTSKETLKITDEFFRSAGREPVAMCKSAPGFIANRLQHALYRESVYMVEEGIATPEAVDKALKTSFAPRYTSIGIFEHFDYAGLDMITSIEDYLFPVLCNADKTQNLIREKCKKGELGFKTGKGVYDWKEKDINDFRKRSSEPYFRFFNWTLPKQ